MRITCGGGKELIECKSSLDYTISIMRSPDGKPDDPRLYGAEWASDYDSLEIMEPKVLDQTVDVLARLAADGSVLEVAAGTGRVSVPLSKRGVKVVATDASPDMIEILRAKDADSLIKTDIDVLPNIAGQEKYSLICILLNSIWVMSSAEEQRTFIRNAAKRLTQNGVLVVEMGIGNPQKWSSPVLFRINDVEMKRTSSWSPVSQRLLHSFKLKNVKDGNIQRRDTLLRIIFPAELLLMAELEGLKPRSIWGSWDEAVFKNNSSAMIVAFERR